MTEDAFLQAISDHPDDDTNRLVYADWLEENGQSVRAELIRVQCALAGLLWQSDEYPVPNEAPLREREAELFDLNWEDLLEEYPSLAGVHWEFHRGLVEQVRFDSMTVFRKQSEAVFKHPRIRRIGFRTAKALHHLTQSPLLARVSHLDLAGQMIRDHGATLLASSPHIGNLTGLHLGGNGLTATGVRFLARSKVLTKLRFLHLGWERFKGNRINIEGLSELASANDCRDLRELFLDHNAVGPHAGQALGRAAHLANLAVLELAECNLGPKGIAALAESEHLGRLQGLYLRGNNAQDAGAEALGSAPFPELRTLCLWGNHISDAGARAIAGNQHFARLVNLDLCGNRIGQEGASALAQSPHLANLEVLVLASNEIGDPGAMAIAQSPWLKKLRKLNLYGNPISQAGAATLLARFGKAGALS